MAARRPPLARLIGRRIAQLRVDCELTQERLAWESGLEDKGYLSRIESGERLPSLDVLQRLARRLNVEPRDLLLFPALDKVSAAMEALRIGGTSAASLVMTALANATGAGVEPPVEPNAARAQDAKPAAGQTGKGRGGRRRITSPRKRVKPRR